MDDFSSTEDIKLKNLILSNNIHSETLVQKFIKSLNDPKNKKNKCVIDELYERAQKYNKIKKLKVSAIFLAELENKVEKEDKKFKSLENSINSFKNILSEKTISKVDKKIFTEFLLLFTDNEQINEEIKNIKIYFNFEGNTSIIEKYIFYRFKMVVSKNIFSSSIDTIELFKVNKTFFYNALIDLIKYIELIENEEKSINEIDLFKDETLNQNISSIDKLISYYEQIVPDLHLKIIPIDIISFTIMKFQENSLLKFLFELTLDDLRDITNSLAGSTLDINDINNYQTIKYIINILKEKSGFIENEVENKTVTENIDDINFFNLIQYIKIDGLSQQDFKEILEKSAKNQPKLLVLFDNRKGFESSKEEIKSIIEESIFEIFYTNEKTSFDNGYNCKCIFAQKTKLKTLKELNVLQQLASLSQNKDKTEENKILNNFIDLIENIKDILTILS